MLTPAEIEELKHRFEDLEKQGLSPVATPLSFSDIRPIV
jgi:hypothetical protein